MNKIATQDANRLTHCTLEDGTITTVKTAQALGYGVVTGAQASAGRSTSYLASIMALPEAAGRPAAAAALGAAYDLNSLPLAVAASMLRGLSMETTVTNMPNATLSAADYTMFKRKAELRCAGLTQAGINGNARASKEAAMIRSGMSLVDTTGMSYGAAFDTVGLDARAAITAILKGSAI